MAHRHRSGSSRSSDEDGQYRPTTLNHRRSLMEGSRRRSSTAKPPPPPTTPYDHDDDYQGDAATTVGATTLMGSTKLQRKVDEEKKDLDLLGERIKHLQAGQVTKINIFELAESRKQQKEAKGGGARRGSRAKTLGDEEGAEDAGYRNQPLPLGHQGGLTRQTSSNAGLRASQSARTLPHLQSLKSMRPSGVVAGPATSARSSLPRSAATSTPRPSTTTPRLEAAPTAQRVPTAAHAHIACGRSNTVRSPSSTSSSSTVSQSPSISDSSVSSRGHYEGQQRRGSNKRKGAHSLLGRKHETASVLQRASRILERLESSNEEDHDGYEGRHRHGPPRSSNLVSPPSFRGLSTTGASTPNASAPSGILPSFGSSLSLGRQGSQRQPPQRQHSCQPRLSTHCENTLISVNTRTETPTGATTTSHAGISVALGPSQRWKSHFPPGAAGGAADVASIVEGSEVGTAALEGLDALEDDERELVDEALEDFAFVRKTIPRAFLSHEEDRTELRTIDYLPLCNARPVDLSETLRVVKAGRKIRLFINITAYNESGDELKRTLAGIAENLPVLNRVAGLHWSEILINIILDGIELASESMMDLLQHDLKLFDPTLLRNAHNGRPVVLHLFERTMELPRHSSQRDYHHPLQLMLSLKARNGGKLNSHLWFFSGFCVQVNPKYTMLLDVGTVPRKKSILKVYQHLEDSPQVGGTCGEIAVRDPRPWNLLDASQTFEYQLSAVLDKPAESFAGSIAVLPGAWSCYRWVAIRGEPLCSYFLLEEQAISDLGPAISNMYLAEDRVLCYEIVAKQRRSWLLSFVSGAAADTDAPATLVDLIKQRRRWMNGAFFAQIYSLLGFGRLMKTAHSLPQKAVFLVQFFFNILQAVLGWFGIAFVLLSFLLVFDQAISYAAFMQREFRLIFICGYTGLMLFLVIAGLAGKIGQMQTAYFSSMLVLCAVMMISVVLGIWLIFVGRMSIFVGIAAALSLFAYLVAALIHNRLFKSAVYFVQYLSSVPVALVMFPIYSFSNLHDISWGTREGTLQAETRRMHAGKAERSIAKAEKALLAVEKLKQEGRERQHHIERVRRHSVAAAAVGAAGLAFEAAPATPSLVTVPTTAPTTVGPPYHRASLDKIEERGSDLAREEMLRAVLTPKGMPFPRAHKLFTPTASVTVSASSTGNPRTQPFHPSRRASGEIPSVIASDHEGAKSLSSKGTATAAVNAPPYVNTEAPYSTAAGGNTVMIIDDDLDVQGFIEMEGARLRGKENGGLTPSGGGSMSAQQRVGAHGGDAHLRLPFSQAAEINKTLAALENEENRRRRLIAKARRAARLHAEAAAREKRLAEEMSLNKTTLQQEFNLFRIRLLTAWLLSNGLLVVLFVSYDPSLQIYANFAAVSICFTFIAKLMGTLCFRIGLWIGWAFHYLCDFCYRTDVGESGYARRTCCLRSASYWALDELWELEHMYVHAYPDLQGDSTDPAFIRAPPTAFTGELVRAALGGGETEEGSGEEEEGGIVVEYAASSSSSSSSSPSSSSSSSSASGSASASASGSGSGRTGEASHDGSSGSTFSTIVDSRLVGSASSSSGESSSASRSSPGNSRSTPSDRSQLGSSVESTLRGNTTDLTASSSSNAQSGAYNSNRGSSTQTPTSSESPSLTRESSSRSQVADDSPRTTVVVSTATAGEQTGDRTGALDDAVRRAQNSLWRSPPSHLVVSDTASAPSPKRATPPAPVLFAREERPAVLAAAALAPSPPKQPLRPAVRTASKTAFYKSFSPGSIAASPPAGRAGGSASRVEEPSPAQAERKEENAGEQEELVDLSALIAEAELQGGETERADDGDEDSEGADGDLVKVKIKVAASRMPSRRGFKEAVIVASSSQRAGRTPSPRPQERLPRSSSRTRSEEQGGREAGDDTSPKLGSGEVLVDITALLEEAEQQGGMLTERDEDE